MVMVTILLVPMLYDKIKTAEILKMYTLSQHLRILGKEEGPVYALNFCTLLLKTITSHFTSFRSLLPSLSLTTLFKVVAPPITFYIYALLYFSS